MQTKPQWDFWDGTDNYSNVFSENKSKADAKNSFAVLSFCLFLLLWICFCIFAAGKWLFATPVTLNWHHETMVAIVRSNNKMTRASPIVWKFLLSMMNNLCNWIVINIPPSPLFALHLILDSFQPKLKPKLFVNLFHVSMLWLLKSFFYIYILCMRPKRPSKDKEIN